MNHSEVLHEASEVRCSQTICERISREDNIHWRKSIAEMKPIGSMSIHNLFPIEIESRSTDTDMPFDEVIASSMRQRKAVAATDASVKEFRMG